MGMTMTQKILAAHAGLPQVKAGQLIEAKLDMVLANDITGPVSIGEFYRYPHLYGREYLPFVYGFYGIDRRRLGKLAQSASSYPGSRRIPP